MAHLTLKQLTSEIRPEKYRYHAVAKYIVTTVTSPINNMYEFVLNTGELKHKIFELYYVNDSNVF